MITLQKLSPRSLPFSFGAIHGLVDFASAMVIYHAIKANNLGIGEMFNLIVGYDVLAFGSQVFIGILTDRFRSAKPVLMAGLLLLACSIPATQNSAIMAAVLAGFGNALFHVGAGAMSLRVSPGKAVWPGVFVGPGAIGLAFGIRLGKQGLFFEPLLMGLLVLSVILAAFTRSPEMPYKLPTLRAVRFGWLIVILLLLTVVVRSIGGIVGGSYCVKTPYTALYIAAAAFAGKCFGGYIADRFGWLKTSLLMLLVSSPMIAYGYSWMPLVIGGMLLFQMTMPVTLTAIAQVMPRKPATAFGLTCLALIFGALPMFNDFISPYKSHHLVFGLILFSAATTTLGLYLLAKHSSNLVESANA